MLAKVAVILFACCAVALARPQDDSTLQQVHNQLPTRIQSQNYNPNQEWTRFQGLSPNQLQGYSNMLRGLNVNQVPGLNLFVNPMHVPNNHQTDGQSNSKYKSPILEVPNRVIDWGQNFVDTSVSNVGSALGQAYDNTEHVVKNVADTVNEAAKFGIQDTTNLIKAGVGIFGTIPRLGFSLLTRNNNNNNNNGFRF